MKSHRSFAVALIVVCLSGELARGAEDRREVEGRELFTKGEYVKALDIYAKLFAEKGDPVYLRNVGRCYQKLKQPEKAIDAFREYLRRAKVKPKEQQEVEGFVREMEELQSRQPSPRSERPPPQAAVLAETTAAPPPPPSPPSSEAPPPGHPAPLPTAVAAPTPNQTPAATLTSPSTGPANHKPITHRWWFWAGVAGVVAAGVVTAVVVSSDSGRLPCPPTSICP